MDSLLLINAKKDIPKYFAEFKAFWEASNKHISDTDLVDCYGNTLLYKNWQHALNHVGIVTLDSIFRELHEDMNAAFFHGLFGQYRSALMHLRSVIELSLQLLYFYQHEVEFSQWKIGEFRIKHEELTEYLKKHPNLVNTSAGSLILTITQDWKTFSKYIHAEAPNYFQSNLESTSSKTIIVKDFNIWKSYFLKTGYRTNKLFILFFRDQLAYFPTKTQEVLTRNLHEGDVEELSKI